jgi:hypothetical protein
MKLSDLRLSIDLVAAWRVLRRLFGLTAVLVGLSLVGCSRYVEVPIPEHCPSARWESDQQTCREVATGRFTLPECCGREERAICSWTPCLD